MESKIKHTTRPAKRGRSAPAKKRRELDRPRIQAALGVLAEAWELALAAGRTSWDFALELQALGQVGAGHSQLRWLIAEGLIEHRIETTRPGSAARSFRRIKNLALPPRTCFVLTEAGRLSARQPHDAAASGEAGSGPHDCDMKPHWDPARRELWFGGELVKGFRVPAANQERILGAFEEEDWPPRIDDPLPGRSDSERIQRLRDTLKALNQRQRPARIRFGGDGTGQGVLWKPA